MSISKQSDLEGMIRVSEVVAHVLKAMRSYAQPGMSTKQMDDFGARILKSLGAKSAPMSTYRFPGWTCISVGEEFCHGIPSPDRILKEGDLINIDVSAELNGFWSDNGSSFILGRDTNRLQHLVDTSKAILKKAIENITHGYRISDLGHLIETEARANGYRVIKNLAGHGIGRQLHEEPSQILNYRNRYSRQRFKKNSVVAIETFISTKSTFAETLLDGWTLVGDQGGYMAQHEHTIVVTAESPIILTQSNGIFN